MGHKWLSNKILNCGCFQATVKELGAEGKALVKGGQRQAEQQPLATFRLRQPPNEELKWFIPWDTPLELLSS